MHKILPFNVVLNLSFFDIVCLNTVNEHSVCVEEFYGNFMTFLAVFYNSTTVVFLNHVLFADLLIVQQTLILFMFTKMWPHSLSNLCI